MPIVGSNDLNYSLVSNKTKRPKIGSLVRCSGPNDLGQKHGWTYLHYDVTKKKTKNLTQLAGELWLCKVQQISGARGTKRV